MLDPAFVERVLDSAFANAPADDRALLAEERERLTREIENLTAAIASGGDIPALAAALKDRDKRLRGLDARLAPREEPDRERLRAALMQRVKDWSKILREHVPQARQIVQRLIGPIHLAVTVDDFSDLFEASGMPVPPAPHTAVDFCPAWAAEGKPYGLLAGLDHSLASPRGYDGMMRGELVHQVASPTGASMPSVKSRVGLRRAA